MALRSLPARGENVVYPILPDHDRVVDRDIRLQRILGATNLRAQDE